jgi:sugar lactone lactonase YvrE
MRKSQQLCFWRRTALLAGVLAASGLAAAATGAAQYVIANDDVGFPFVTTVTFFAVSPGGALTRMPQIQTGGSGISGGFFGANRISVLKGNSQECVYASEAFTGDVVGISISSMTIGGRALGSPTDGGTSNGIGLVNNGKFVYASFTDSNTIGTYQVMAGCGLAFVNDVAVSGLASGVINGMAVRGNMLIVTYTDGTIESFDISAGTPVSHGDKQYSTATLTSQDATYPNSIDITSDGHFAIFGDTSTAQVVEVSDISSGKLTRTMVHTSKATISSSNIMLSPDETLLYVSNTQGDSVSAYNFDKSTGRLSGGCVSGPVGAEVTNWSYLTGMSLINPSGNGGGVYVAEFGTASGIAMITLTTSGKKCTLQEAAGSPFLDPHSLGLLSIGTFPPRAF